MGLKATSKKRKLNNKGGDAARQDRAVASQERQRLIEEAARESTTEAAVVLTPNQTTSVQDTCDLMAALAEGILEDPDTAFSSPTLDNGARLPSPMRQLLAIAATQDTPEHAYTAHLAIMSLLAVFTDILPSYRIRLPTDQERAVKVSKDTKQLWDYEKALLQHYQQYLKLLEGTWQRQAGSDSNQPPSRVASTAMRTLAALLQTQFAFNFGAQLLQAVVRATPVASGVGDACCAAVMHVFGADAQGQIAAQAAREMSKLMQKRNFKVRPQVIQTFLALPLRVHADEAEAAKLATRVQAKKRKKDRELASIAHELREGEATVDKILLARAQADALQAITVVYFRILKNTNVADAVLPAALEGLAKFSHLINMDTVLDVLDVLKTLLQRVEELPLEASLHCILTAFLTLQGPGRALKIDVKEYILPLYHQIPRLITASKTPNNYTDLVIQCCTAAFLKRREYSSIRMAAFCKQLMTTALHTPATTAVPLLALVRQILQRYSSVQQLLDNEQDVLTAGEYTPDARDPERANPLATAGWELATLRFHVDARIRLHGDGASRMTLLQFPAQSPDRLHRELVADTQELYIPFSHRVAKKHPLATKDKKGRPRFLKARFKKTSHIPVTMW
jgi:nucleolar complex protein 3